jgi:LysR substrate binding domain-containing protein
MLHACRAAGFEPPLSVEGGEMDAVLRFVEAEPGGEPSMALAEHPRLRGTPLAGSRMRGTIALAHRRDATLTNAARAFHGTLFDHLGSWRPAALFHRESS